MNSSEIKKNFEQKVDKAYTGYFDNSKMNRLFKDTMYRVVNEKLDNYGIQKNRDEISFLIKTGVVKPINNNKIAVADVAVDSVTIVNPAVYQVTFATPHNVVAGDSITISGVQGTLTITQANGTFTPTIVDEYSLQITVAFTSGVYTPGTGKMTFTKLIDDFYRLLTTKARVKENTEYTVEAASNYSPIKVRVTEQNNLRSGEKITISGVVGNTNANGDFYIRKVNGKEDEYYELSFANKMNFYFTALDAVKSVRISNGALKLQVKSLTTTEELDLFKQQHGLTGSVLSTLIPVPATTD